MESEIPRSDRALKVLKAITDQVRSVHRMKQLSVRDETLLLKNKSTGVFSKANEQSNVAIIVWHSIAPDNAEHAEYCSFRKKMQLVHGDKDEDGHVIMVQSVDSWLKNLSNERLSRYIIPSDASLTMTCIRRSNAMLHRPKDVTVEMVPMLCFPDKNILVEYKIEIADEWHHAECCQEVMCSCALPCECCYERDMQHVVCNPLKAALLTMAWTAAGENPGLIDWVRKNGDNYTRVTNYRAEGLVDYSGDLSSSIVECEDDDYQTYEHIDGVAYLRVTFENADLNFNYVVARIGSSR
jgi:hypothetical protein